MKITGFSLLEVMLVLSVTVLLMGVVLPSCQIILKNQSAHRVGNELLQAIQTARQEALANQMSVTLCKSSDQKSCIGNWQDGFILKTEKEILYAFKNTEKTLTIHWRSRLNWPELIFLPTGFTPAENGVFWGCLQNEVAWIIVLNQAGRPRWADKDEINVNCSTMR